MKKIFYFLLVILFACNQKSPDQKKAEKLVGIYLDSLNGSLKKAEIIDFGKIHPIYNSYANDPNYDKFKDNKLKLDSIKTHFIPQLTGWEIYVSFKDKDTHGYFGTHTYQCVIDKNLTKCYVGLATDKIY